MTTRTDYACEAATALSSTYTALTPWYVSLDAAGDIPITDVWLLDDIVALFPDFTEDGTKILLIHGTVVTEVAATTVQYWQGIVRTS